MSTTYKGFEFPEVMPGDRLFHIICDEGVFDGYSEKAVLERWKHKVDVLYRLQAMELGYVELSDELLGCPTCGSVVFDVHLHINFHEDLTS